MLILLAAAWLLPVTFLEYRTLVFKTMPLDDYTTYVLYLATNGAEGQIPGSPFKERILSIIPAVGLFKMLPVISLTKAAGMPDWFMKASFAISLLNSLSFLLAALIVYSVAARLLDDKRIAFISSVFLLVCANYLGMTGVDGVGVLVVALIVLFHANRNFKALTATLLASPFINEKILIFAIGYLLLSALSNRKDTLVWVVSLAAFLGYVLVRKLYGDGNEDQLQVGHFSDALLATLRWSASVKGLYLNVFPVIVLLLPMCLFLYTRGAAEHSRVSPLACLLGVAALLCAALASNVIYSVGRVVMYALPAVSIYVAMLFDSSASQTRNTT